MSLEMLYWCSFCNSEPSDGEVTLESLDGEQITLYSCRGCFKKEAWNNLDGTGR